MKRILILGGGFAGVECCLDLESYFKNNKDVEITLVSEDNFLLFTPMLPQVASGTIETRHIVTAIRTLIDKTRFFEAKIKNTTENLDCLTNKAVAIIIAIAIIMGSVPIAIKPPIKAPTNPMLLVKPIKKNRKFETRIKIEKYNNDFFIQPIFLLQL